MNNKIHIFVGHFGSGKTELALNFAVKQAEMGKNVSVADMDTVNPYFRSADAKGILNKHGINVITSEFALTNVDIPTIPMGVNRLFSNEGEVGIIDVGGDEDGAYVLGVYRREIEMCGYNMYFVVNTKRPLTQTAEDITEYIDAIENASGLKVTHIINNTNIGKQTTAEVLMSGYDVLKEVSENRGIPIIFSSGTKAVLSEVTDEKFEIEIFLRLPWEKGKDR